MANKFYDYSSITKQFKGYGNVRYVMSHINLTSLESMHYQLDETKEYGIDKVSRKQYSLNLHSNITKLLSKMKQMTYKPYPVKRIYIPKSNKKLRPIGVPSYSDKLVQGVMANILNAIYEHIFLDCSFGFRPNRNCHQALKRLNEVVTNNDVNYIVEADIKSFFDNVNHQNLLNFMKPIIQDKRFMYYTHAFLKAGVIEDTDFSRTRKGTPQGGLISPILANIYLHYILDQWFEDFIRPKCNFCYLIRYADDFIVCFKEKNDSEWFLKQLTNRFKQYKLELEPSKTRAIDFYKSSSTFDFLGFTISKIESNNKQDNIDYTISSKSFQNKKSSIKYKIKKYRNEHRLVYKDDFNRFIVYLNSVLSGIYKYYNTCTSTPYLDKLYNYTILQLKNHLTKKQIRGIKQQITTIPLVESSTYKTIKFEERSTKNAKKRKTSGYVQNVS